MRKFLVILSILISAVSLNAQSLKHVKVFCTDSFNTKAPITVIKLSTDPLLVVDALKNNLIENGFKVLSEKVARERIELSNNGKRTDSTFSQDISLGKTTYVKSVYAITLTYNTNYDNALTDLQGQIVDLASDGEIVATFSFRQSGAVPVRKPRDITKLIAQYLSEKKNKQ